MAMSNLPGVEDLRSISRFGLSVVTVIFKEKMGTYLPRQLVQEKLNEVKDNIPEGFGTPEMGPISTGLGEILQYTLIADTGMYTAQELRTLQDWTVKRQLNMIPGVVEVNSFGGSVKQYEIAFSPAKLNALHVSINELFEALHKNNINTGGAYIEKDHKANFIRGDGIIKSLDDIKNIVVKNTSGVPITIGDAADEVHYGSPMRYGAFTQDGHEAVGGTILMLKGANSAEVIGKVKSRLSEIQRTLPPGVQIKPFLDRSQLIERTTSTIASNLTEGALIVIFVLVVLLGSLRGGLVTASVIPLSLLFAFILMRIFGVGANLMSLGAIDFGIIVDGAVIIVEGTVHELTKHFKGNDCRIASLSQNEMNQLSNKAASTMMHSAFFGQMIILVVFAPILFLEGVSGKMFRPMAFTFSFALLGAILLCLTYVPMITTLSMRPLGRRWMWLTRVELCLQRASHGVMSMLYSIYHPVLKCAMKHKVSTLAVSAILLAGSGIMLSRMGSEFIPSLDEGDIAMQTFLRPGSSLS